LQLLLEDTGMAIETGDGCGRRWRLLECRGFSRVFISRFSLFLLSSEDRKWHRLL
jgi:hypothetical protein